MSVIDKIKGNLEGLYNDLEMVRAVLDGYKDRKEITDYTLRLPNAYTMELFVSLEGKGVAGFTVDLARGRAH